MTKFLGIAMVIASESIVMAAGNFENDAYITEQLVSAAVAHKITQSCERASPKMIVAFGKMMALKAYAQRQGASDDEIDAFLKNDTQKERIIDAARAYLATKNMTENSPAEEFCALGEAEIKAGSVIGQIIRVEPK